MKGFVTLATGNIFYYKLARNLLRSYRIRNNGRFAILCDRENEYTKEFDDVIILNDVKNNYSDKFKLLIDCPYDENIFIEPDCLIYNNIDCFWDLLSKEYDFSSFGWNDGKLNTYFDELIPDIVERYFNGKEENAGMPCFCVGYLFIRKGEKCKKIYNDILEIQSWLSSVTPPKDADKLLCRGSLRDDPIIQLATKINNSLCVALPNDGKCMALPGQKKIYNISIKNGTLETEWDRHYYNCNLLHFTTRRCREEGLYLQQSIATNLVYNKKPFFVISIIESKFALFVFNQYRFLQKAFKKLFK